MVASIVWLPALTVSVDIVASPSRVRPASRSAEKPCAIIRTKTGPPRCPASARIFSARPSWGVMRPRSLSFSGGSATGLSATDATGVAAGDEGKPTKSSAESQGQPWGQLQSQGQRKVAALPILYLGGASSEPASGLTNCLIYWA